MSLSFPRHVHKRGGVYTVILDAASYQAALGDGWRNVPDADWPQVDVYREWTPRCGWPADAQDTPAVELAPAIVESTTAHVDTSYTVEDTQPVKRSPGRPRKNPVPVS